MYIEGIPVRDMKKVKSALDNSSSTLIGPNCPGLITAEESKIGITPVLFAKKVLLAFFLVQGP